jgi:hypothetical protein
MHSIAPPARAAGPIFQRSLAVRLRLVSLISAALMLAPALGRAAETPEGPKSLLITYRAETAAQRPAFRRYLQHQEWKKL